VPAGTFSTTSAAHAVHAGLGAEMLLVAVVDQRVQPVDRLDPDVAAAAAVATVRSAELDELLAPERDRASAAIAGADIDFCLVEKLHFGLLRGRSSVAITGLAQFWKQPPVMAPADA
jgi:hypothetical protein